MALNDFFAIDPNDQGSKTRVYDVIANTTVILPGEPVIQNAGNPSFVAAAGNGASNSATWIGIAATTSTQTASANGQVYVIDDPKVVYRAKATTPANLAQTILNTKVTLDLAGGVYKVDEDDTTNGTLTIKDFNATEGTVDVQMSQVDHISN